MILTQGMRLAMAGVVLGLIVTAAMGRLLTSLLFGVSPFDVTSFAVGSLIFLGVAALAGIIPAQRAARTPPAVALQAN
jgi:ABC-type lipoprotein release transport system permease subunit